MFWISLIIPVEGRQIVRGIIDNIPKKFYFLKKYVRGKNDSIKYFVVCPKCCTLFQRQLFPTYRMVPQDIPKCNKKKGKSKNRCNAFLYKRVKHGSHYKLVPKLLYSYFPIKESLIKLHNRPDFHKNCELWRTRRVMEGVFTDNYDGADFENFNGKPFLLEPYNLALKLNVDWIQPFDHT